MKNLLLLIFLLTYNGFTYGQQVNVFSTKIKSVKTVTINPAKKYIELQIKNTTPDTLYLQQLSVNTYERSMVVFNSDKFDTSEYDAYILINDLKAEPNEPIYPFRVHRDTHKEDKAFLSSNKGLKQKSINNYNYYVIAPKMTVVIRTIVTVQTGEIARIPDMSTQERDDLSFQLGFMIKYKNHSEETDIPLWLWTEKSEPLKKEFIKWMY